MAEIKEITDRTPNPETVSMLERMLEMAKSGELRTVIVIRGFDTDGVSHCWSKDHRNSDRRLLSELAITQHEFITSIGLREGDSILAEELDY